MSSKLITTLTTSRTVPSSRSPIPADIDSAIAVATGTILIGILLTVLLCVLVCWWRGGTKQRRKRLERQSTFQSTWNSSSFNETVVYGSEDEEQNESASV